VGADPNATDEAGMTPLMLAALGGHAEVAAMLLAWGADVNRTSRAGSTALRAARSNGHNSLAEFLREVGAKE
jgi:ankyrin repeat protein